MGTNMKKRLFLGNLPDGINEKDIRAKFNKFGQVNSIDIKVKKVSDGRESSTFAFVELSVPSESQLHQCVSCLDGSDINGNSVRVQVAKESFLSRLQAEREQSGNPRKNNFQEKDTAAEQKHTANSFEERKHRQFDNSKNADFAPSKGRQGSIKIPTADYNPLQMFKNRPQKDASNQEESLQPQQIQKSPKKKSWKKTSNQVSSKKNDEEETEEFKGGLPKFGGTKSLASSKIDSKDESNKPSGGFGSLMSQLESYSGMWNDQDVAPVEVDYQRKRKFQFDAAEEETPTDDNTNAFQRKAHRQEQPIKGAFKDNFTEQKEKPTEVTDSVPKQKTITEEDKKKKELDNQKRIMSLQQRNDALKAQQNLIKSALKLTNETQNKKKFFFNDESADTAGTTDEPIGKKQQKPVKPSEKRPKLFDEEDEDEENIEDYGNDFKSRPQFDTARGQELLELQSRFGRDERFKLDHRFADHDEEPEPDEDAEHDEKDRQMAILGSIVPLGPSVAQSNDSAKNRIKSKAFVRYDPNAKDHEKFEKVAAPVAKDGQATKKKGKFEPAESAPLPEVSAERFYETSGPIDIGHSQGFSLRAMFQRTVDDEADEEVQAEPEQKVPEKPEMKEPKTVTTPAAQPEHQGYWKNAGMWHEQLFFQDNDSRLKEALDFIRNPSKEEPYADRAKWAEYREKLKYFYRNKMRRHTVWAEGPSRQQQKKPSQPEQVDETAFQFYGQPDAAKKKKKPHRAYYK